MMVTCVPMGNLIEVSFLPVAPLSGVPGVHPVTKATTLTVILGMVMETTLWGEPGAPCVLSLLTASHGHVVSGDLSPRM